MAAPKIAINGFGRIGRTVIRIAKLRRHFDVVAINDLVDPERLAYGIKYDSVHGRFPGEVKLEGRTMTIDGDRFQVLSEPDPAKLPWRELGIDYVIEATGQKGAGHRTLWPLEAVESCPPAYPLASHRSNRPCGGG